MANERTEAAPEANGAAAAPAASGGIKAWLPLIVMIVLMPVLAFAMTNFVIVPKLQKGLGGGSVTAASSSPGEAGTKGKKEGGAAAAKKESVPLNKLLVNVAGTMGARYLLVSLSVVGGGADFKAKMEEHDAQLRDMAQGALRTKTIADLEKPAAQNLIRNELISGFNSILGDGSVEEIYFPEFAIQ
jgi:flagellar FliL protein